MQLTTMEIATRCNKSERTVQRWIKEGKLPALHIEGNVFEVSEDDLQPHLPRPVVEGLSSRLDALEQRIDDIEGNNNKPVRYVTPPRPVYEHGAALPDGAVLMHVFVKVHRVGPETVRHQVKTGVLTTFDLDSVSRPGQKERYFTPEQQRQAIQTWKERHTTGYHQCDNPECPCHQGKDISYSAGIEQETFAGD